mmetsp:Transcript_26861/g.40332  ORF Transcript_26861/g.40332 Transcript_26861/m.40332 type:complete len:530 (+) Transcript_26861:3-1592(+)
MDDVPVLREYEVDVVKKKLGEGGFCTVSAVHSISITDGISSSSSSATGENATGSTSTSKSNDQDDDALKDVNANTTTTNTTTATETTTANSTANTNVHDTTSSPFTTKEQKLRQKFANQFNSYKREHFTQKKIVIPQTPSLFSNHNNHGNTSSTPESGDPTIQRPPKLALKQLKSSLIYGTNKYRTGVHDLMAEISILSKCRTHPNIIFLHAVGYNHQKEYDESESSNNNDSNDHDNNDDNNDHDGEGSTKKIKRRRRIITFAIIDQLRTTLKNKICKWKEDRKNLGLSSLLSLSSSYGKKYNDLWLERMVVLFKVADAIAFLHSRGILHRDINPSNIGFTEDNVVKLFDFGLAKELRGNVGYCNDGDVETDTEEMDKEDYYQRSHDDNELFDLTGNTGTLRYMAPEIAAGGVSYAKVPYGFKVDVYSLSLVIYEVLSLTKPYAQLVAENFDEEIVRCGHRPPLDDKTSWPLAVRTLLGRMWNTDVTKRPCSKEVVASLGELLRGEDADLYPNKKTVVTALKRQFVKGK